MSHTYATVDEFKAFAVDNGLSAMGTANDAAILGVLEAASRRVEGYTGRSRAYQSGFGPRTGTNKYDAQGWYGGHTLYRDNMVLELDDDLISATQVTFLDQTGGNATTVVEGTDFYFQPYNSLPRRRLVITGLGATYIVPGLQVVSITGTWGYAQEVNATSATLGTVGTATTSAVVTGSGVAVGNTLRVDSEDLYVTAYSGGTATFTRGANGTTAAAHSAGAAISVHAYPREVHLAALLLAVRRWRTREAGLTGDYGGASGMSPFGNRDTDLSILAGNVAHLKILGGA